MCMEMGRLISYGSHMGFSCEWEYDQPWDENEMGIRPMGMGIRTWEWGKIKRLQPIFVHKFHMLQFYSNIT